jgi:hypothetical protein
MSQSARSEGRGPENSTFPATQVIPLHAKIRAMLDAEPPSPPLDTLPVAQVRALREGMMLRRAKLDERVACVDPTPPERLVSQRFPETAAHP